MVGTVRFEARIREQRCRLLAKSRKMLHAALLLLMLEARSHGDLVSPSA